MEGVAPKLDKAQKSVLHSRLFDVGNRLVWPSGLDREGESRVLTNEVRDIVWNVFGMKGLQYLSQGVSVDPVGGFESHPRDRLKPGPAGQCLSMEYFRTFQFWQALRKTLDKLLLNRECGEGPIDVLYIGSGPFASLSLPASVMYQPSEVQFHVVDPYDTSVNAVAYLAETLGVSASYPTILQKDAVDLDFSRDLPREPQVVIMEIMARGLMTEPQVAVVQALKDQFHEDLIMIPERVSVGVGFKNHGDWRGKPFAKQAFFELTKDGVHPARACTYDPKTFLAQGVFALPREAKVQNLPVYLTTRIDCGAGCVIDSTSVSRGSGITVDLHAGYVRSRKNREKVRITARLCHSAQDIEVEAVED